MKTIRTLSILFSMSVLSWGIGLAIGLTADLVFGTESPLAIRASHAQPAGDGPGTQIVRSANQTIAELLRKQAPAGSEAESRLSAQVVDRLRSFLDIDALGREALRDHWNSIDRSKRDEFVKVLRQLIEKNYVRGLRANLDYQVVYLGEKREGPLLLVSTKVNAERRGRPYTIAIDYVLRMENGQWRAFDIVTDGIGLVDNYRAQFNKIIAKEGIDGLVARMKKKLASMT